MQGGTDKGPERGEEALVRSFRLTRRGTEPGASQGDRLATTIDQDM